MAVETDDGWERGVTVLGPAQSGNRNELRVKFFDGTVDDWDVVDFVASKQLPNDLVKLVVSSWSQVVKPEQYRAGPHCTELSG
eukprot:COSAG02_NODE_2693_length_8220_cov_3.340106_3_plen_83_part_00